MILSSHYRSGQSAVWPMIVIMWKSVRYGLLVFVPPPPIGIRHQRTNRFRIVRKCVRASSVVNREKNVSMHIILEQG